MDINKQLAWDELNNSLWRIINRQDMKDREIRFKAALLLYELHFKPADTEDSISQEISAHVLANQLVLNLFFQHMDIKDEQGLKEKVQNLIASFEASESNQEDQDLIARNRLIAEYLRSIFEGTLQDHNEKRVGF